MAALYPDYAVKTTGHSLGGAIAQLIAMMLTKKGYQVSMINFGQPRVGDDAYAAFVEQKLPKMWRHVHHKDTVPHIPPENVPLEQFLHSANEIYEDAEGKTFKRCVGGEDRTCADQWHSW